MFDGRRLPRMRFGVCLNPHCKGADMIIKMVPMKASTRPWILVLAALLLCPAVLLHAAAKRHHKRHHPASSAKTGSAKSTAPARTAVRSHHRSHAAVPPKSAASPRLRKISYTSSAHTRTFRHRRIYSPWTSPTFADSTSGDSVDGEDLMVRRAAVQALGPYNGSVVVVDPYSGRILSMVNQKLALSAGFEPCSTIKIVASLAGLSEGVIDPDSSIRIARRTTISLTQALARSNNFYFATVGTRLGFDKITDYARLFGMGEKAGLNIEGEQFTPLPDAPPADGLGMMTSFGEGFYFTPLQLAAIVSAVANGGTLYYLQYPKTPAEIANFVPRVKRHLDIAQNIPAILPGMMGAVEFGTARRAQFDPDAPIFGKTGTCTDNRSPTHLGWFASFQQIGSRKLAVVVLLTGGRAVNGPVASGVAGSVYRNLVAEGYYAQTPAPISPAVLANGPAAVSR
jgi:penicillin-binding protein 2